MSHAHDGISTFENQTELYHVSLLKKQLEEGDTANMGVRTLAASPHYVFCLDMLHFTAGLSLLRKR